MPAARAGQRERRVEPPVERGVVLDVQQDRFHRDVLRRDAKTR